MREHIEAIAQTGIPTPCRCPHCLATRQAQYETPRKEQQS